ncbi:MAG TPA: hypothetical protein VIA45_13585 [Thermoanaerobaculia bacterium]
MIAALRRLARERGLSVWLVGGAPRDALLGLPALDLDVAVPAQPRAAEDLARALASAGFGTLVALSEEPPRVYRVAGRRHMVDLAELERRTITEDLGRRDFTANALAIDLSTGQWLDPYAGTDDLARRRLRLVRRENLSDDPLRTFRAARFVATHGLAPDRAVSEACRAFGPRLAQVAPERIGAELTRLLEAPRIVPAWRFAVRTGLLSPALRPGTPAGLWKAAGRTLSCLEPDPAARLPADRRRILRLAAIARALGLGPGEAAAWLRHLRRGSGEAGRVARLLEAEGAAARLEPSAGPWAWIHDSGDAAEDALFLLVAERPAARSLARRLRLALASARRRRRARGWPEVSGSDVMAWTGGAPGPKIGRLLRDARIEILAGRILSRGAARRWAEGRAASTTP